MTPQANRLWGHELFIQNKSPVKPFLVTEPTSIPAGALTGREHLIVGTRSSNTDGLRNHPRELVIADISLLGHSFKAAKKTVLGLGHQMMKLHADQAAENTPFLGA